MSARDRILARIRQADIGEQIPSRGENAAEPIPANFIAPDRETLIREFIRRAADSGATVELLKSRRMLDDALASLSRTTSLAIPSQEHHAGLPDRATSATDAPGILVHADAGIAETGTVCLHSGQLSSRSLFLCDHLVVLLDGSMLLRYQEDYWYSQRAMVPRAVHLITGPSRTADVEQTLQIGAHGPKQVTILLTLSDI